MAHGDRWENRCQQGCAGQRRNFTRHAVNTEAVRQVGCELQREQGVIKLQVLTNVLAQRRVKRQLQQAAVVFSQFEFFGRAQHSLAFKRW